MQTTFGIGAVETTGAAEGMLVEGAVAAAEGVTVAEETTGACIDDVTAARVVVVVGGCAI